MFEEWDFEPLVRILNECCSGLPLVWPATLDEFREAVSGDAARSGAPPLFEDARFLVAEEGGAVLGFAHTCRWQREESAPFGLIRCLVALPRSDAASEALASAALDDLRQRGLESVAACVWATGYPWYQMGDGSCFESQQHLVNGFLAAGFRRVVPEVLMGVEPAATAASPAPQQELEVHHRESVQDGTTFRRWEAFVGGDRVAEVVWFPCSERARHPSARQAAYVWWVHTEPDYRRRGIARYLLVAALNEARDHGCREVFLHADTHNQAARSLYRSLGFRVLAHCTSFAHGPGEPDWR